MFKMKIMKKIILGLAISFLLFTFVSCDSSEKNGGKISDGVYVTKSGRKYHKEWCRTIKGRDVQLISIDEAHAKGKSECKVCYK